MFAYDKTFDPEVVLGHCDLISRFSDFALYNTDQNLELPEFFFFLFLNRNNLGGWLVIHPLTL